MSDGASTEFLLSPGPSAEGDVTDALRRALRGDAAVVLDRAATLITELLASGDELRAAGDGKRLSVKVLPVTGSVRIEIRDDGTGVLLGGLRRRHGLAARGWTPHLLSRVSDRWGLVSGADGAWVWFELDLPRIAS
jgi:hypothetical protein